MMRAARAGTPASAERRALERAHFTNRRITDFVIAIAIVALFTGFEQRVGGARLRLFDLLAAFAFLRIAQHIGLGALGIPKGMTLVLVMFAIHALSAFFWDIGMGLRELVQVGIVATFACALVCYLRCEPGSGVFRMLALLLIPVIVYNIYWHVSNGYMSGWKILNEPKVAFVLLPTVMAAWLFGSRRAPLAAALVCAFAILLILLSGERKAYLLCALAVILVSGWSYRLLVAGILGFALITSAVMLDSGGYVSRQIATLAPEREPDIYAVLESEAEIRSISNFARQFSTEHGLSLVAEHPITGVGTGRYKQIVDERFPTLPAYLRVGLHGEFQRVLVENGIVGILVYLAAWLLAFWNVFGAPRGPTAAGFIQGLRGSQLVSVMTLFTFLIYCAFEGSTTISLLAFALAPFAALIGSVACAEPAPLEPSPQNRGARLHSGGI